MHLEMHSSPCVANDPRAAAARLSPAASVLWALLAILRPTYPGWPGLQKMRSRQSGQIFRQF